MIKSMTGYGAGKFEKDGKTFLVELKSVNHKYYDLSVKLPRIMLAFEDPVRKILSSKISRGKVDVFISFESVSPEDNAVLFNEVLGDNIHAELSKIKERYSFREDVSLSMMLRFPGVVASVKKDNGEYTPEGELWSCLENAVNLALDRFLLMRKKEGETLGVDLHKKIDDIEKAAAAVDEKAPFVVSEYKDKINTRLKDMIIDNVDEQRIAFEVAIFADKASIDEELTRLKSHIKQFRIALSETNPIGKKLDFLAQEMLRESNTIGSKSNDVEITNNVIQLKTLIEKVREQVQNVE